MARKQETPAPTTDAKDPVSTVNANSDPSGAAGSPPSPAGAIGPASGGPGNSGVPAVAPGQAEGSNLVLPEGQVAAGTEPDVVAGGHGANAGIAATDAAASEDASLAASSLADSSAGAEPLAPEDQAKPNPATLQIYPLRSYMDEGELRRRGGPAYTVPRRHAEELVQRNLASLEPLKE